MSHMVKDEHGYDVKVPSQGQVTLNTVLGAIGSYGTLAGNSGNGNSGNGGILGNLFGGNRNCSGADTPITRYEMGMQQALAYKDSEIMELKANIYNDQKNLELYRYIDGKFAEIQANLAAQAVTNTSFNSALAATDYKFTQAIALEAERRQCADGKIVNYVNSTFSPKLITDYSAGTTSAPANVYNPLCTCNGGGQF